MTLAPFLLAFAADFASLVADRAAIERVYYDHRVGTQAPFEQVLPRAALENLVRLDLRKEAVLRRVYAVEISEQMLRAEVERINGTTRAPAMLAEIKATLRHDPARFADAFAKPILVESLLRRRFENDDALHAPLRRQVERTRAGLLAARKQGSSYAQQLELLKRAQGGAVSEATLELGAPPAGARAATADELEIQKRFGPDAKLLSQPRDAARESKHYFADLPGELQDVLRAQLRESGDVSAVIETPAGFLLYVARQRTAAALSVATLSLPKRAYERWLEEQRD